jgi:hypothetical protein
MSKNRFLPVSVATVAALLLAAPASAKCTQPSGRYFGGGAGPAFSKAGALLGNQVENWDLTFPTKTLDGTLSVDVRTPPQPGVATSLFGTYSFTDRPQIGAKITWDPAGCKGSIWVDANVNITWYGENKTKTFQTYVRQPQKYNYRSSNRGDVVILTMDPDSVAAQFPAGLASPPPYIPGYSIRLEQE